MRKHRKEEENRHSTEREKRDSIIIRSPRIKALLRLNKRYKKRIDEELALHLEATMADVDPPSVFFRTKIPFDYVVARAVHENIRRLKAIDRAADDLYASYKEELKRLPDFALSGKDGNSEQEIFRQHLFNKETFGPTPKISVNPGLWRIEGRKHKDIAWTDIDRFNELWLEVMEMPYWKDVLKECDTKKQDFAKKQRNLVTPGMRYDVMQRDGFRCQLCGASQSDGVRLHVDHILPISKGGKTEMSNLRTLCERCNLGKGAKIEVGPSSRVKGAAAAILHNL